MSVAVGLCSLLLALLLIPTLIGAQPATTRYVSRTDPTCAGNQPCYPSIQAAVDAAVAGDTVTIQAGRYQEQLSIQGKNNTDSATEADRILIEADPQAALGSVILASPDSPCESAAIRVWQSSFVTLRGLTITRSSGPAIRLLGGANPNHAIHIERNRVYRNIGLNCDGGIRIEPGNSATLIVNNLIYGNSGAGVRFLGPGDGPHYVVNNTIHASGGSGIAVVGDSQVLVVNNAITGNGLTAGSTQSGYGIQLGGSSASGPAGIQLLHNLICGNRRGEIHGTALDDTDAGNLTPTGSEGPGVGTSPGCELPTTVYAEVAGADGRPNTADDDFILAPASPAIGQGLDPRTLGLDSGLDALFEADFVRPDARLAADSGGGFDIGAIARNSLPVPDPQPPQVTIISPRAGGFLRGAAAVQAQAAALDAVTGLTLRAGSQSLTSSLQPAPPARATTATATWQTATVPDGVYTFTAAARDLAGRTTTASRLAIVDNTPPDTEITSGPASTLNATTVSFTFTGTDNLTAPGNLVFAWRLDGGSFSTFSASTTKTVTGLMAGLHTFQVKAQDQAGNEDPTPAQREFTVLPTATPQPYTLTVRMVGTGSGTVAGAGIYVVGALVALQATPAAGSSFAGWSPAPCAPSFAMPASTLTCTATFTLTSAQRTLNLSVSPVGAGTTTPAVGSSKYSDGIVITLSATPASGYSFQGWGGDADCADGSVTMAADRSCIGQFQVASPPVTPPPGTPALLAACDGITAPASVQAGAPLTATVRFRNLGTEAWRQATQDRAGSQSPQDNIIWGLGRIELASSTTVNAGEVGAFTATFTAPGLAGTYNFDWRMVREWVAWYGDTCHATITVTSAPAPPAPPGVTLPLSWASRASQPGVRLAKPLNSVTDITTPVDTGTTGFGVDIRTPAPGYVSYDATMDAMRISVPASFGTPANSWAYSLPYAQQFDQGSEFWIQYDVRWDAGMLTPSNGGGGIKWSAIDEGDQSDGHVSGNCDNGGNWPMEGEIVTHFFAVAAKDRFPTLYHSCGYIQYPGNTSGQYEGLYGWDAASKSPWLQNKITGCTYAAEQAGNPIPPCVGPVADTWYTVTEHVKVGTWYRNDGNLHHDSQIDFWFGPSGTPQTNVHSQKSYDLVNASPGQARYGKLWLYAYDTGRTSGNAEGNVWYRNVLWSSQPLADPATGRPLLADGSAAPPANPAPGLTGIPANGWLAITPAASTRYIPVGDIATQITVPSPPSNQPTPSARSYSGITYGGGKLYYVGGGHFSYPGNDVEQYDPATNTWTQSWMPEVCPSVTIPLAGCPAYMGGQQGSWITTPLNRLYVGHFYQQAIWRPDIAKLELMTRESGGWQYDPVARAVTPSPTVPNAQGVFHPWGGDVAVEHVIWSPELNDRLVFITSGGTGTGVWRQDQNTLKWAVVAPLPAAITNIAATLYSAYVASQHKHLMMGINGGGAGPGAARLWYWFDATTYTFTPITLPAGADVIDTFDYDSKNDKVVGLQDSVAPIKLWVGSADASSWTQQTLTAAVPANNSTSGSKGAGLQAVGPNFVYDPVNNVFWYLQVEIIAFNGPTALWAYRYQ
jgi:hypothetical protein